MDLSALVDPLGIALRAAWTIMFLYGLIISARNYRRARARLFAARHANLPNRALLVRAASADSRDLARITVICAFHVPVGIIALVAPYSAITPILNGVMLFSSGIFLVLLVVGRMQWDDEVESAWRTVDESSEAQTTKEKAAGS